MKIKKKTSAKTAAALIEQIRNFGIQRGVVLFLVGGYVRDRLLRHRSHDIDIVLEGDALAFSRDFARSHGYQAPVFYGRFGTAMLEVDSIKIEFATARKESYSDDSRKPIVAPATIYEDLSRRDFTINAIAENLLTRKLLDPFGGKKDLKEKILRTPIDPDKTFFDDPLRILRGVRFAAVLGFTICTETKEAMKRNITRLNIVSRERIADEILKTLGARRPGYGFRLLDEIGALDILMPEVSVLKEKPADNQCKELLDHTLLALDNAAGFTRNRVVRLATLLHDIGKPRTFKVEGNKVSFHRHEFVGEKMSWKIMERLMIPQDEAKKVAKLIRYHLRPHLLAKENPTDNALARFIREIGPDMKALFYLASADITSRNPKKVAQARERVAKLYERITLLNKKMRLAKFKLAVDGHVIMELLGLKPGIEVGRIKKLLEEKVLDGTLSNRKTVLKQYIQKHGKQLLEGSHD